MKYREITNKERTRTYLFALKAASTMHDNHSKWSPPDMKFSDPLIEYSGWANNQHGTQPTTPGVNDVLIILVYYP